MGWKSLDFTFKKNTLAPKYIGMKANNAICKYYLKGVKLSFASQIKKIEYKKYFGKLGLTIILNINLKV